MRLTVYRKFLLILLPAFAAFVAVGLAAAARLDSTADAERLALRVGNLSGRVASALGRHAALDDRVLAEDFLGMFGNDPAVLCVELVRLGSTPLATYPTRVGCLGTTASETLVVPVSDEAVSLVVHYTTQELASNSRQRALVNALILAISCAATLASASIGFRLIVGARLRRLHRAITDKANLGQGTPHVAIDPGGCDELADIIDAYNAQQLIDAERERALLDRNEALDDQSRRDPLTGLHNRRHFERWVERAQTDPANSRDMLIALIDIDHFKSINDKHGHSVGDEVLIEVSRRLAQTLRLEDVLVRWGGEEFLLLMTGAHDGEAVAQRLLASVSAAPMITSVGALNVAVSMGVVWLPPVTQQFTLPLERVIVMADHALYSAKAAGRRRAACVDARHVRSMAQFRLAEAAIEQASGRSRPAPFYMLEA